MTQIITRFAPSPTGNLHIGSARTALINYIVSRQNSSSKFYIRIEDTDKERSKEEFTNNILSGLKWLGIKWENEIQIQSKRISRHQQVAHELLKKNFAYKCVCSLEKLNLQRELIKTKKNLSKKICINCKNNKEVQELTEGFVIRIKLPDDGSLSIEDKVQGKVSVMNKELDDFILLRKDNTPTYMLSVVVDDNDIGVNFIIRGDDHLNNTFRQYYIYKYLNWNLPKYAHI
ncbi:glutamate--tRNA ligase family protein, partial [Pelagibacteraceae bacterium]|nr:glutamate--tRNA ligase family protein [Pelagibacteraceae bacterium]